VRDYYACQDANFNVVGLLDAEGELVERYEYTPYGQRTLYGHDIFLADFNDDGIVDGTDESTLLGNFGQGSGMTFADGDVDGDGDVDMDDWGQMKIDYGRGAASNDPFVQMPRLSSFRRDRIGPGLCDIGHQGLMHDREFGLVQNRARYLSPRLGRFTGRDPLNQAKPGGGYQDGMSLYQYIGSVPVAAVDPMGLHSCASAASSCAVSSAPPQPITGPLDALQHYVGGCGVDAYLSDNLMAKLKVQLFYVKLITDTIPTAVESMIPSACSVDEHLDSRSGIERQALTAPLDPSAGALQLNGLECPGSLGQLL